MHQTIFAMAEKCVRHISVIMLTGVGLAGCGGLPPSESGGNNAAMPPAVESTGRIEPMMKSVDFRNQLNSLAGEGPQQYRLGPGDILSVDLIDDGIGPMHMPVGPDGRIYFDLLDGLDVNGLTVDEARERMETGLRRYSSNPQMSLGLVEARSRTYTLLGRVMNPGVFPLDTPVNLVEAVARAGGLAYSQDTGTTEDLANLSKSFLLRDGSILPVNFESVINHGEGAGNVRLQDGDFIYIPSALSTEVFVLGAVWRPRGVPFKKQISLAQALATAGGPRTGAQLGQVVIVRGALASPAVSVIDVRDIISGRSRDVLLESGDLVYVPEHPLRKVNELAWFAVTTFARTVAVNEGSRLASDRSQPVGLNIDLGPSLIR